VSNGSFSFSVGETETVACSNLSITFVAVANDTYGVTKAGKRSGFNRRYFSVDVSTSDPARAAAGDGVPTFRLVWSGELRALLGTATALDGPVWVDGGRPPLDDAATAIRKWVA